MKSGTMIGVGLLAFGLIAGVSVFYLQAFVYYQRDDGRTAVAIGGADFAVRDYEGLDNPTLPLRLRGCFQLDDPEGALAAGAPARKAEPFTAPFWFDCWAPETIAADLAAGRAQAVIAEEAGDGDFATQRIVVVYPDGRAYQWRRLAKDG